MLLSSIFGPDAQGQPHSQTAAPPKPVAPQQAIAWPQDRTGCLLAHIDPRRQLGLEIGALCRPVVTQDMGDIRYVDHMSTADLQSKYAHDTNVDIKTIVPVHYVWGAQRLPEAVRGELFDYVIASHVIEHVPDTIGWLQEISEVLKPGGLLSLAIPDMRYTFDCLRECSTLADLVEAYLEKRRQPNFRQVYNHFSEVAAVPSQVSTAQLWAGTIARDDVPLLHPDLIPDLSDEDTRYYFQILNHGQHYMDVHCHVYTPESFVRLLKRLAGVNLLGFRVRSFFETRLNENEFFLTLEKLPPELQGPERRNAILQSIAQAVRPTELAGAAQGA